MPRQPRFQEPDLPYHVTQRGNYQQVIFTDDADRRIYLDLLAAVSQRYGLEIWCWCLMDNHVHFLVYPTKSDSLSRTFAVAHMRYAQILHRRNGLVGHLWQGRFHSCALAEEHLYATARYVELNPVKAGVVETAADWPWSSVRYHLGLADEDPLVTEVRWPDDELRKDWPSLLKVADDAGFPDRLALAARTGRPFGSEAWMQELEVKTGRRLTPGKAGRPRRTVD